MKIMAIAAVTLVLGGAGVQSGLSAARRHAAVSLERRGRILAMDLRSRMRGTVGPLAEPYFLIPESGLVFVYQHPEMTEDEILRSYDLKRLLYPRRVTLTMWDPGFVESGLAHLTPDFFVVNLRPEAALPGIAHFEEVFRGEGIVLHRFKVPRDGPRPR